jgi:hypothetical protein
MTHLWEMETAWFEKPDTEYINGTFDYKSWKEFQECKPYKLWKPYILSSWSWKQTSIEQIKEKQYQIARSKHILESKNVLEILPTSQTKEKQLLSLPEKDIQLLQIVFISPSRFYGMHRAEMYVTEDDEDAVREWLKRHMPSFWKV